MWRKSVLAAYVERFLPLPYVEEFLVRMQRPLILDHASDCRDHD